MPNVPSVLVVGGGLTSAAVSRALRRQLPVESVTVWEALGSLGGRMHTERASVLGVTGPADTGAQYVTVTDDADARLGFYRRGLPRANEPAAAETGATAHLGDASER